jgi:uncharacterized cupredoxin-like copper-binding protein
MVARARALLVLVSVAGLALPLAACSGGDGGVAATEQDFTITLEDTELPAGETTFDISNEAEQTHEFVVIKTDLAADQLPTDDSGDVDENGEGIEPVDEVEDIAAGSTESLTVNLDPGNYVVICNLPGHYRQGMHQAFTVS